MTAYLNLIYFPPPALPCKAGDFFIYINRCATHGSNCGQEKIVTITQGAVKYLTAPLLPCYTSYTFHTTSARLPVRRTAWMNWAATSFFWSKGNAAKLRVVGVGLAWDWAWFAVSSSRSFSSFWMVRLM